MDKFLKKAAVLCWVALFFVMVTAMAASAEIMLDAPQKAVRGNAFVATASASQPVKEFRFEWLGKTIPVLTQAVDNRWQASVLLPVPLDHKAVSLMIVAKTVNGQVANQKIVVENIARPVQKLKVDKKYVDPPVEVQERIKADRAKVRQALAQKLPEKLWELPFERPVPGSVSSQFGLRRVFNGKPRGEHRGLDLRGAQGTPIHALSDGIVALADNLYYSGNTVYVNHGNGVFSAYLHMSKTNVKPGQRVSRGQVLGEVGATGRVTGPHLHLSVFAQGQSVDPLPLLAKKDAVQGGNQ